MSRILVIEDNESERECLVAFLKGENNEVAEASNGKSGIRMMKQESFDLVITDIFMPEQDGLQTILEIRAFNPEAKIIAVSGGGRYGEVFYLNTSAKLGADDILEKPIRFDQLLRTMQKMNV